MTRGIDRGDLQRDNGRHPHGDSLADAMVDMSLLNKVAGQFVIRRKGAVYRIM